MKSGVRLIMNVFDRPMKFLATCIAALAFAGVTLADEPKKPELLVFAAASLTNVLGELAPAWEKASGVPVKLSFAASSVLARQIEAGSNADVFISADQEWMDYLQTRKLIAKSSRVDLVRQPAGPHRARRQQDRARGSGAASTSPARSRAAVYPPAIPTRSRWADTRALRSLR